MAVTAFMFIGTLIGLLLVCWFYSFSVWNIVNECLFYKDINFFLKKACKVKRMMYSITIVVSETHQGNARKHEKTQEKMEIWKLKSSLKYIIFQVRNLN